jgi:FkbM family methyltransferase
VQTEHGRFLVDPASQFGSTLLSGRAYEPEMLECLRGILRKGDCFLDVGANEGFFTIIAATLVGPGGEVLGIEPQSRLQSVLFRNIAENGVYNVHLFQRAISDSTGMATLSLAPDVNTGSSGLFRTTKYRVPTEIVPQTTLSNLLKLLRMGRVRLMKVDVEGFEYEVILGSKQVFEDGFIENIALELHPTILARRGKSGDEILQFLLSHGYRQNHGYRNLVLSKA